MTRAAVAQADRAVDDTFRVLHHLLGNYHPRDFAVRLWDGTTWPAEDGQSTRWTLVLKHPGALRRMLLHPTEVGLGEAYLYDDVDIEGNIVDVFRLADHVLEQHPGVLERLRLIRLLLKLPSTPRTENSTAARLRGSMHSQARDRQAVRYHYDISNDFYALWLDQRMVYSCAYFESATDDIDTAQERKLDYICRKLRLRPGERLLDIGCGWGGLIMYAAQHYGVEAHGITLSRRQADLARARIQAAGLEDVCQVEIRDYRDLAPEKPYDKIVSVGMIEHVGSSRLKEYFTQAWRLLRPGGVFLNHGIVRPVTSPPDTETSFSARYVFPDSELLSLTTTLQTAESCGFEIRDVESLREHYALTLRHWVRRLKAAHDAVSRLTNEVTYRVWLIYMSYSIYAFEINRISIHQTLLAKPEQGNSQLPLTRADWYQ